MDSASVNAGAAIEAGAQIILGANPGFWIGPELIGSFIDAILCGIMIMQFAEWVPISRTDRRYTKIAVYVSFTASIATTIYSIWCAMHAYVFGFGVWAIFLSPKYVAFFLIPDTIMALLVQAFFADRAYRLIGNNKLFLGVAGALILFSFASSIVVLVKMVLLPSALLLSSMKTVGYTWVSAQLATDLTMTGTIMYGLFKSRTGWSDTDRLVKRLLALSMETQLPPTLLAMGLLITYTVDPSSPIDVVFLMAISKAYVCGFLGALISRGHLRRNGFSHRTDNTLKGARSGRPTQATVHLAEETHDGGAGGTIRSVGNNGASPHGGGPNFYP